MPWRTLDNYAIRRRQELHERRKAQQEPEPQVPQRSARARTSAEQQAIALRRREARQILKRMRKLRDAPPEPGQRSDRWTLEQDRTLLEAFAAGVPLAQIRDHMVQIRPKITTGAVSVRFSMLRRTWGLR